MYNFKTYQKISVSRNEIPTFDAPTTTILALTDTLGSRDNFRLKWFNAYFACWRHLGENNCFEVKDKMLGYCQFPRALARGSS